MNSRKPITNAELEMLQHKSFSYFLHETNPVNGLVIDKNAADWPASIAALRHGIWMRRRCRPSPDIGRENRQKVLHADIRCGIGRMELWVKVVVDLIREKLEGRNTK